MGGLQTRNGVLALFVKIGNMFQVSFDGDQGGIVFLV
jgi:hypothetical protein